MNKEEVINHMIAYIESEEKDLQAAMLANESKSTKADIVNRILKELRQETEDEN